MTGFGVQDVAVADLQLELQAHITDAGLTGDLVTRLVSVGVDRFHLERVEVERHWIGIGGRNGGDRLERLDRLLARELVDRPDVDVGGGTLVILRVTPIRAIAPFSTRRLFQTSHSPRRTRTRSNT